MALFISYGEATVCFGTCSDLVNVLRCLRMRCLYLHHFSDVKMIPFACRYGVHVTLHNLLGEKVNASSKAVMAVMYITFCNSSFIVQTINTQAASFSKCCIDGLLFLLLSTASHALFYSYMVPVYLK